MKTLLLGLVLASNMAAFASENVTVFTVSEAEHTYSEATAPKTQSILGKWRLVAGVGIKQTEGGYYNSRGATIQYFNTTDKNYHSVPYYILDVKVNESFNGDKKDAQITLNNDCSTFDAVFSQSPTKLVTTSQEISFKEVSRSYKCGTNSELYYEIRCRLVKGSSEKLICEKIARIENPITPFRDPYSSGQRELVDEFIRWNGKIVEYLGFERIK